jgi:hypothetical protein
MNCHFSNLIEGHNTLPIEIDRALAGHFGTRRGNTSDVTVTRENRKSDIALSSCFE